MLPSIVDGAYLEIARGIGDDGHEYIVYPIEWTLAKIQEYWKKFEPFHIFSGVRTEEDFLKLVAGSEGLWFEMKDEDENEVVGVMYLTDLIFDYPSRNILQANWHATVWDSKIAPRRDISRAAIVRLMKMLKIHRLVAQIPMNVGGAIRAAKKLGFVQEGVARKAKKTKFGYVDLMTLSVLDTEVEQWALHRK